ncbi:glycosyl hydrolase [Clathrospora elynae]|uniref:Glycosyl hydrolase n=1 Tax=Clathrospora elynae TaxID=706981 RepID=A0A6A5T1Z3_9PLEO|nr:glycosyl hydrolase [Clathrospora elynae]
MKYFESLLLPFLFSTLAFADYADDALAAIHTLQDKWYNFDTGLWDDLWWQSGNMIETIARFGLKDPAFKPTAMNIISNTYAKSGNKHSAIAWRNDFYDDMGWWAMGWIASYDLTGNAVYLNTAKELFHEMAGGWNTPCNGGLWWDKEHTNIAAISNELFLSVGAHLANRVSPPERDEYLNWAQMEWDWFWNSGIINAESGLVNDGIDQVTCQNDGKTTFTYNQGVILAGLSELARAKSDGGLIGHAYDIANTVLNKLTDKGILTEPVAGPLDIVSSQFKGAFVRGLSTLNENEPQQSFTDFLKKNAGAVSSEPKVDGGVIPDKWQGGSGNSNPASHAAGIDVLVAAV